ncbi:reverse transcriptase domain-containing protein [Tanacetum coccineum]|uniref:Reverse transcriptase domain-containing protein n=1 Tax=Tanacetum coccineum TaxID=301880 RepID=A0ABQ5BHA7_9ASTR
MQHELQELPEQLADQLELGREQEELATLGKGERKSYRCGDPNDFIGECLKPQRNKNQKAFVSGSWSDIGDEDEELKKGGICTVFREPPYPFDYPMRRLTMKEILAKFINEGRREHVEMEIFIKEFRTTNELLLKTRRNLLSELKIEVNELSKVVSNVLILKNEVTGVTTMGRKITSEATRSKEINEIRINENEPPRFKQDEQEKPHDDEKDPRSFTTPCQVLEKHKEAENLTADHLSRFENPHMEVLTEREIADKLFDEHSMVLKSKSNNDEPCYADFVNYIVGKIRFYGFPQSRGNKYILVAVDYAHKWVEAQALPMNDARVVVKLLRSLFARLGVPKALISDRGTHFCNSQLEKDLQRYGVTHKLSMAYHPQSNRQTEVTNSAIKRILERSVGYNSGGVGDNIYTLVGGAGERKDVVSYTNASQSVVSHIANRMMYSTCDDLLVKS